MSRLFLPLLLTLGWHLSPSAARALTGEFQLSPSKTGHVVGSFAVSAGQRGRVKITLFTPAPYEDDRGVRFRMFMDDSYSNYQQATSCYKKILTTTRSEPVAFGNNTEGHFYEVEMEMDNTLKKRPHYYYFVVDDCSMEAYGSMQFTPPDVPVIYYGFQAWNNGSHLSADEAHLKSLHAFTFGVSATLALLMGFAIMAQLSRNSSVHITMFLVMAAAVYHAGSSLCEIATLSFYSDYGTGIALLESISAHFEAVCDSLVALMLLSIAAGWMLPTDVIPMSSQSNPTQQQILGGFQSPINALRTFSPTAVLAVNMLVFHIILAQWGCQYNNDFDSYHDYEHLPGKMLMGMRIVMGMGLVVGCLQTRMRCPYGMRTFYARLAIIGTLWFQSLPLVIYVCNHAVPFYLRHRTVGTWSAGLQSCSIAMLSWLVTTQSSTFQKCNQLPTLGGSRGGMSYHLSTGGGSFASPGVWRVGKAKIRCD
jgi:hypothetical protein